MPTLPGRLFVVLLLRPEMRGLKLDPPFPAACVLVTRRPRFFFCSQCSASVATFDVPISVRNRVDDDIMMTVANQCSTSSNLAVFACAFLVNFTAVGSVESATTEPAQTPEKHQRIREARHLLIEEALEAQKNELLPTLSPDFAQRFAHQIPQADLTQAILVRTHPDPFVDAYVRWQLTSFDPSLPELSDQDFANFMDAIPALIPNPRAAPEVVSALERIEDLSVLSARRFQQVRDDVAQLDRNTDLAERFNEPAISFAKWVQDKLGRTGPRPRQWLLARCAATIQASWSTRSIKTSITRNYTASIDDQSLTTDHRRLIVQQAQRLVGSKGRFVKDVTFLANRTIRVTFSSSGVTRDDVKRWSDRLAGIRSK